MRGKASVPGTDRDTPSAPAPGERPLRPIERQMIDDLEWAESEAEVQRHQGKLVVVHRKRVIEVGTDRRELVARAAAREGCPPEDLVVVIVPRPGLWEIPR